MDAEVLAFEPLVEVVVAAGRIGSGAVRFGALPKTAPLLLIT